MDLPTGMHTRGQHTAWQTQTGVNQYQKTIYTTCTINCNTMFNESGLLRLADEANMQDEEVPAGSFGVMYPGPCEGGTTRPEQQSMQYDSPTTMDVWDLLMMQVRGELRAMNSRDCYSKAMELQKLARSEIGFRSSRSLSTSAMKRPEAVGQPFDEPSASSCSDPFMSISPLKLTRCASSAIQVQTNNMHHVSSSSYATAEPFCGKKDGILPCKACI